MTGTSGAPDGGDLGKAVQPFFKSKRAAAVLKHAIVSKYIVPFAAKTGSTSAGNRVVIVDGYAGAGRYEDGSPGSPALIADAVRNPALRGRTVECFFVEQDEATYQSLRQVLAEVGTSANLVWEARHGNVADHLAELLARAEGVPLFLFLDPFGLGLPFDVIAGIFDGRPSGLGAPATEVLFRFDAGAIRRIRGVLHGVDFKGRQATLETLDRAAGGSWWRDEDDPILNSSEYLEWFEERLLREVCIRAKCAGWTAAVRQREGLQPVYLLIFLTRHPDGMQIFGEALSSAQEAWRQAVFNEAFETIQQDGDQVALITIDPVAAFKSEEQILADQWVNEIERNLRGLLREREQFSVRPNYLRIFGSAAGLAREKHLRKSLQRLEAAGLTTSDSKGKLYSKLITRAPAAQP